MIGDDRGAVPNTPPLVELRALAMLTASTLSS